VRVAAGAGFAARANASGGDISAKKKDAGTPRPKESERGGFFFDGHRLPSLFRKPSIGHTGFFFVKISPPEA